MEAGNRILFCDFDGEFELAEDLTRLGYLVDQIRPDGLRSVAVGDHCLYVFSFGKIETTPEVLRICRKLKSARLPTPIALLSRADTVSEEFTEHRSSSHAADDYIHGASLLEGLLDCIDRFTKSPFPLSLRGSSQVAPSIQKAEEDHDGRDYEEEIKQLQKELTELRESSQQMDKVLEAQRNFYKPKLKALLEGQKMQSNSEVDQLLVKLSEVEAKLLEREARVHELEQFKKKQKDKVQRLLSSHQKAQQSLRHFYQEKLKSSGMSSDVSLDEVTETGQADQKS